MRTHSLISWIGWNSFTFGALAGACLSLYTGAISNPSWWAAATVLPSIALFGADRVRRTAPAFRAMRVGSWALILSGFVVCVLMNLHRFQSGPAYFKEALPVTLGLPMLALCFFWMRDRQSASRFPFLPDLRAAAVCLAILVTSAGAVTWLAMEHRASAWNAKASAAWAAMDRPMAGFEKRLARVEENDSLRALITDLKPFGVRSFYKATESSPLVDKMDLPPEVFDVLQTGLQKSDQIVPLAIGTPWLDAHSDQLREIYGGILNREPPRWALDPAEGIKVRVPSYLSLRLVSHLFAADAIRRLSAGDREGASAAVEAGLRMSESQDEQPFLIGRMIRIALQATFIRAQARLAADPAALNGLAAEIESSRESLRHAVQFEAWLLSRVLQDPAHELSGGRMAGFVACEWLPEWTLRPFQESAARLESGRSSMHSAATVAHLLRPVEIQSPDMGREALDAVGERYPSTHASFVAGCVERTYANFLLREQAAILRTVRETVSSGDPAPNLASVVIPGAHWKVTNDPLSHAVALTLAPIPQWVSHGSAITSEFYLMPLDGSDSWQLGSKPAVTASLRRQ